MARHAPTLILTRAVISVLVYLFIGIGVSSMAHAQESLPATSSDLVATTSTSTLDRATSTKASSTTPLTLIGDLEKQNLTQPEEVSERQQILMLLDERPVDVAKPWNLFAFWMQEAIRAGIPANTIVLILLVPVLATIVTFVRIIVGLPSLEMLVPIVLSFALVAVGIWVGLAIIAAVVLASYASRQILKETKLMFFAKRSLSLFLLSIFVLATLTAFAFIDETFVASLSIFPLIILTLLGDSLVSVQLHKSQRETLVVTCVTLLLGVIGYVLATLVVVRDLIILYPEVVLLTLILNVLMGRYFGLRLTELVRFRSLAPYGSE